MIVFFFKKFVDRILSIVLNGIIDKSNFSDMKESQERKDSENRALQKDLLEYKEQMKNSLEEVLSLLSF